MKSNKKICFLINNLDYLISHRLDIVNETFAQGYDVYLIYGTYEKKYSTNLLRCGIKLYKIPLENYSINIFKEIRTCIHILHLFLIIKPDILHLITIKSILYGGLISLFLNIKNVVCSISGLGITYSINNLSFKKKLFLSILFKIYKFIFSKKNIKKLIFQNTHDRKILCFSDNSIFKKSIIIKGAGVDLDKFKYSFNNTKRVVVLMASRPLIKKGIIDFIESAFLIKKKYHEHKIHFVFAGEVTNEVLLSLPKFISKNDINKYVDFVGFKQDIIPLLQKCDLVVLPSYSNEGLPKILIEASACGKPIITSNMPGCRDAILPNKSGLLIPIKSPKSLSKAILKLSNDKSLMKAMSINARKLAESRYSIKLVVDKHLNIYKNI